MEVPGAASGEIADDLPALIQACIVMRCAKEDDNLPVFVVVEVMDTLLDVVSIIMTWAEGDLSFANDEGGVVLMALVCSVSASLLLDVCELVAYRLLPRPAFITFHRVA